jgi:hypothetical protein
MATLAIPATLNFKTVEKASPSYTYLKVPMNSIPSGAFTNSFTTQTLIDWKLPNKVVNLGRSYIGYVNVVPAELAGIATWVPEDTTDLGIANASLMSSQGFDVMNLNYSTNYLKIGTKLGTSHETLLYNGPIGDGLFLNSQLPIVSNYMPVSYTAQANNVYQIPPAVVTTAVNTSNEVQYLSASALATASTKVRQFPLSWFKETILALDKDVYFGPQADMFLRFMVGGNKCGFTSTSATNPNTAATAFATAGSAITDMYLYLCVENNPVVIDSIMATYANNKLMVQIPYTVAFKTNNPSSTVDNVTINITRQYGKYLKKIVHTLFNGTESANTNFDMSNWNASKIQTYNTFLDSTQLQPQLINCSQPIAGAVNSNDYAINKKILKDSALVGLGQYQNNWFHCDQFFDDSVSDRSDGNNISQGLPLNDNHIWVFAGTSAIATAINNYTFMTFTRDLLVNTDGLSYV